MYRDNRIARIFHPLHPTRAESGRQHPDTEKRRHMLNVLPVRIAAAVSSLASEILTGIPGHVDGAAVLDRLRRRLNATHAVLCICDSQRGRRVLVSGGGAAAQAAPSLEFDHRGVAIQRLRRAGTVLCRLGEVTGFEDLAPADVHSFVLAAGTFGGDCTPVLLVGWPLPVPPCITADAVPLQVAATLLASTLAESPRPVVAGTRSEAGLDAADRVSESRFQRLTDSVPVPLFVMDVDGRVLLGNQHWRDATGDRGGHSSESVRWSDAMDTPTKAHAATALAIALQNREHLDIDLRLRDGGGHYRWWACRLAPRFGADRQVNEYVGTCHNITETRRAQALLRDVARKLVAAQEGERARIARELHDDLGQQVALLVSHLETITPDRHLRRELDHARESLQTIASALTNLSHQLHPGKVKLIGLSNSLEGLCRDFSAEHDIHISLVTREVPRDLAEDCGVTLYRVAQEAVRNALKHSGATGIAVELTGAPGQLTLRVSDDGKGFDPMTSQASGLGLLTMGERVELAGGVLTVEPVEPRGTTINVVVPITRTSKTGGP